jgi:hypothetical protein
MRRSIVAAIATTSLTACTATAPVAVISDDGKVMRGTATANAHGGSFRVDGGGRTCGGSYDSFKSALTLSVPVTCSDGKKGIAIITRDPCLCSGSGRIRMQDGSEADFVFGQAAEAF